MCILCHQLADDRDWTDAAVGTRTASVARARRAHVVATVLDCYGLQFRATSAGTAAVVSDRKGGTAVVEGLNDVWAVGGRLAKRPLDPLDPALLERLDEATADD